MSCFDNYHHIIIHFQYQLVKNRTASKKEFCLILFILKQIFITLIITDVHRCYITICTICFCLCLVQKVSQVPSYLVSSWYLLLHWQHVCRSTPVLHHGLYHHYVSPWNWPTWSCGCAITWNSLVQVTPTHTWHSSLNTWSTR